MTLLASNQNTKKKAVKFLEVSFDFLLASFKIYRSQNEGFSCYCEQQRLT